MPVTVVYSAVLEEVSPSAAVRRVCSELTVVYSVLLGEPVKPSAAVRRVLMPLTAVTSALLPRLSRRLVSVDTMVRDAPVRSRMPVTVVYLSLIHI